MREVSQHQYRTCARIGAEPTKIQRHSVNGCFLSGTRSKVRFTASSNPTKQVVEDQGDDTVVLLPRVPECTPWCDSSPHEWDDDGHSVTHVCRRTITVCGTERDTELTLERFADVDEEGRAVVTNPVVRVNNGEPYLIADMMLIAEALQVLAQLGQLAA